MEGKVTLSEGVALSVTAKIATFFMRNLRGIIVQYSGATQCLGAN